MIIADNINKSFGSNHVLKDISFEVDRGETFSIIGQSGQGKTVILRHIAGLIIPDSGDVLIDGKSVSHANARQMEKLRRKMGILFQSGALLNWLTVRDNVALPLLENKLETKKKSYEIADNLLKILKLTDAVDKLPADISGGMKKRVALARALVTNPEIILYDEPTSGLDPVMTSMIDDLIIETQERFNVTSVVVTHDMKSAYRISDKIAMLYRGHIVQCGTPDEIKNTENEIVKQFVEGQLDGPIKME